ncbi:YSIRK-type signal peptide-containing protein [Mammaliicoccus sciuri]|uniref:YSIRK-type signal peptide-containing protein n=1 Tax=Mammaliicoccus sciuri TaxID=1296 RepID=UPI002DB8E096|nr:YSIRK-type signal peptide-containing protein [Mammaliicoccus sciuri]MEB6228157.1 YSIRK-type signal peptide-containing protein [Mammaliicoccus sciuri]
MREKRRYSIRKFTVGAGSVLIGLTLYSGINTVEASENNYETSIKVTNNSSEDDGTSEKKEAIKDNDLNTEQVQTPIKSTGQDTKVNETTDNTGNNSNEYLGEESTLEQEHKEDTSVSEGASIVENNEEITNEQEEATYDDQSSQEHPVKDSDLIEQNTEKATEVQTEQQSEQEVSSTDEPNVVDINQSSDTSEKVEDATDTDGNSSSEVAKESEDTQGSVEDSLEKTELDNTEGSNNEVDTTNNASETNIKVDEKISEDVPYSEDITDNVQPESLNSKEENISINALIDVEVLSNKKLDATHSDGKLQLKMEGRSLVNLGIGSTYPTFQLPSQFKDLMSNPNFRDAVRIDYEARDVLNLKLLDNKSITGNDLNIDPNTGVIYGKISSLVSLGIVTNTAYILTLDLNELTDDGILPGSDQPGSHEYNFKSDVGTGIINLDLLTKKW